MHWTNFGYCVLVHIGARKTVLEADGYLDDGVAEVPLLPEQNVGRPGNEAPDGDVGKQVVLLQSHVRQTQVTLATGGERG